MKRKFTLLIAALALLTMMASTGTALGQSDYSSDYTGNITLSTAGGTNASDCVIAISGTNYAGIKAGTSSKVGAVVVTVPSGTKYLHIHAAAWNGTTASLAVTPDGYSENIALTANSGITNNSPFTFNGDPSTSDYYKVITFSDALTANTNLTFTAVGGKRFVIWGVTSEEESSGDSPSITLPAYSFDVNAEGGTVTFEVSSNVDFTHTVAADASDWIHSMSTKGLRQTGVVFRIDANPMLTRRSGTITFNGAGGSETVTVYQKGEIPTIVVSEEEVDLSAEEGVFRVEIASNLDVTYEIPADCDWVRELVTKTISTRTYTFAYDRNHAREVRTCPIVFRNAEYEKAETVSIVQNPAEIVRDARLILCPSTGDTFSILTHGAVAGFDQFRFDTDWPEAVSVTPEGDGNRFVVKVAPNPDAYARQTTCLVYRPGFEEPDRVAFLQFGQLPSFSYVTSQREVVAPVLLGLNGDALVIWGDGTYEVYEEGLTHQYQDAGPHTIRIEGDPLPFVLIGNPQNGMRYDLRNLNVF